MKPARIPLYGFPDVVLHADELSVKRHPQYQAAKAGDITAADLLVAELANQERAGDLRAFLEGHAGELVPIHALESRLDRQALLSQAGSGRVDDPVVTREAWTGL